MLQCRHPRLLRAGEDADGVPYLLDDVNFTAVACGDRFSAGVTASGDLYTWGAGDRGKLGLGWEVGAGRYVLRPRRVVVMGLDEGVSVMGLEEGGAEERFIDVCAGDEHAMALTWVSFCTQQHYQRRIEGRKCFCTQHSHRSNTSHQTGYKPQR